MQKEREVNGSNSVGVNFSTRLSFESNSSDISRFFSVINTPMFYANLEVVQLLILQCFTLIWRLCSHFPVFEDFYAIFAQLCQIVFIGD